MELAIEFIVILAILLLLVLWFAWAFITKHWKLWRYKPENDRGKLAEESRRRPADIQGHVLSEGRNILPTTDSPDVRQDSNGTRKFRFFRKQ